MRSTLDTILSCSHDPLFDPVIKFGYHCGTLQLPESMDILEQTLETGTGEVQLKTEDAEDKNLANNNLTIIEDDGSMSDDQGVDSLTHSQGILDAEDDVQFQWKSDNGVTYRVFQVNHEDPEGESVASDFQGSSGHLQPVTAVLTSNLASNHFYVVGNDVIATQPQRSLAPRGNTLENRSSAMPTSSTRVRRDDRRRATHNEVERRRRDKINNWIMKLSKIIPECHSVDSSKNVQSKGGILAKACEYILDLRNSSQSLTDCLKENERLSSHIEFLQAQNEKLKLENSLLRQRCGTNTIERRTTPDS